MMTSRGLVICLVATFASLTLTLADLDLTSKVSEVTNESSNAWIWHPRNWLRRTDLSYYLGMEKQYQSCTTRVSEVLEEKAELQETLHNMSESMREKEKEICALRLNITHLDTKGVTEITKMELTELKLEHNREITRLRTEKQLLDDDVSRLRQIRRSDMNYEIKEIDELKNKSLLVYEQNIKLEFQSKKLNQTIWNLELSLEESNKIKSDLKDCTRSELNLKEINEKLVLENEKSKIQIKNITDENIMNIQQQYQEKNQEISELNATCVQAISAIKTEKENIALNLKTTIEQLKTTETTRTERERSVNATNQDLQLQISELKKQLKNLTDDIQVLRQNQRNHYCQLKMAQINGKSYYVGEMNDTKTRLDTSLFCKSYGLELCSIESAEENNALGAYFGNKFGGTGWNHFWLSGSDEASEGNWIWTGTGQKLDYTNWDGASITGKRNENCMVTCRLGTSNFRWHDEPCLSKSNVLCELNY